MIELTEWERTKLLQHASATALGYIGHSARGGLRPHEIEDMERWSALSDKLRAAETQTVPLETRHLTDDEKRTQGEQCGCRGIDDYCPCQNVRLRHLSTATNTKGAPDD